MIIQFNASAADVVPSADSHPHHYNSSNWFHERANQNAPSQEALQEENTSKIIHFEMAYPEEPTLFPNYVDEVRAKPFKGASSVAFFVPDEFRATIQQDANHCGLGRCANLSLLNADVGQCAVESLPDAA